MHLQGFGDHHGVHLETFCELRSVQLVYGEPHGGATVGLKELMQ